jgi:hypothetical protein
MAVESDDEDTSPSDQADVTNNEMCNHDDPGDSSDDNGSDDETMASAPDVHLNDQEKIKILLLLATKRRHKLNYAAAECIMRLAAALSDDISFFPSKYIMKTVITQYSTPFTEHHVCPDCGFYNGIFENIQQCNNCTTDIDAKQNKKNGNVFLCLSVAEQIKALLECGLAYHLIKPQHRQKIGVGNYEDIFDGKKYKEHVGPDCISFNFFVDGLQVRVAYI